MTTFTAELEYRNIKVVGVDEERLLYERDFVTSQGAFDEYTLEEVQVVESEIAKIPISEMVRVEKNEVTALGQAVGIAGAAVIGATFGWLIIAFPTIIIAAIALY